MTDLYLAYEDPNKETGVMNFEDAEDVGEQIGGKSGAKGRLYRRRVQETNSAAILLGIQGVAQGVQALSGAGVEGTLALTLQNTWYQCPPAGSVPANDYILTLAKENEAGTIRIGFANASTPSATYGRAFLSDEMSIALAGDQVIYLASSTAGDDVNWGTKIL